MKASILEIELELDQPKTSLFLITQNSDGTLTVVPDKRNQIAVEWSQEGSVVFGVIEEQYRNKHTSLELSPMLLIPTGVFGIDIGGDGEIRINVPSTEILARASVRITILETNEQ